jgi:hypothetical protein
MHTCLLGRGGVSGAGDVLPLWEDPTVPEVEIRRALQIQVQPLVTVIALMGRDFIGSLVSLDAAFRAASCCLGTSHPNRCCVDYVSRSRRIKNFAFSYLRQKRSFARQKYFELRTWKPTVVPILQGCTHGSESESDIMGGHAVQNSPRRRIQPSLLNCSSRSRLAPPRPTYCLPVPCANHQGRIQCSHFCGF